MILVQLRRVLPSPPPSTLPSTSTGSSSCAMGGFRKSRSKIVLRNTSTATTSRDCNTVALIVFICDTVCVTLCWKLTATGFLAATAAAAAAAGAGRSTAGGCRRRGDADDAADDAAALGAGGGGGGGERGGVFGRAADVTDAAAAADTVDDGTGAPIALLHISLRGLLLAVLPPPATPPPPPTSNTRVASEPPPPGADAGAPAAAAAAAPAFAADADFPTTMLLPLFFLATDDDIRVLPRAS